MTVKAVFHTSAKHEELEDLSLEHSIKKKEGKFINDLKSQLLIKKNEKRVLDESYSDLISDNINVLLWCREVMTPPGVAIIS